MTNDEIIQGLQFTIDMFLFDPFTGESLTEPRNDDDKITIDACREAIIALKAEPCEDAISRQAMLYGLASIAKAKAKSDVQKALMGRVMFFTEQLPPVTPKQRTGHWVKYAAPRCGEQHYKCTNCDDYVNFGQYGDYYTKDFKFCPHCGAKMEGGE